MKEKSQRGSGNDSLREAGSFMGTGNEADPDREVDLSIELRFSGPRNECGAVRIIVL